MDAIFGTEINYVTTDETSGVTERTNIVTENTNITAEEIVAEYAKMNLGIFCKSVGMETQQGKKMYRLEDAYGNVKKLEESQVLTQMKFGLLNVINLEITKNNKLACKVPVAMEVDLSNINEIKYFPCLVKVFDLTTETEGTAVAVGYKEHNTGDKYNTVLNVVIKGNMYEASYRSILSQETTCKKKGCLKCDERNSGNCRYNRYGGGWKLCVEISKRCGSVKYYERETTDELIAVAMQDGEFKAHLYRNDSGKLIWDTRSYEDFNRSKFINATFWGGLLEYDVPVIDWSEFNPKREARLKELKQQILELCWQSAREGTILIYSEEMEVYPSFRNRETASVYEAVYDEYYELDGDICHLDENIEEYIKAKADEKNMKLWYIKVEEIKVCYAVDQKNEVRGKHRMLMEYDDEINMYVKDCEWEYEDAVHYVQTNLFE